MADKKIAFRNSNSSCNPFLIYKKKKILQATIIPF